MSTTTLEELVLGATPQREMLPTTFPQVVSNSILRPFRGQCHRLGFYQYMQHYRRTAAEESPHLHAGAAFAAGIAAARTAYYHDKQSAAEAVAIGCNKLAATYGNYIPPSAGSGKVKTLTRMQGALGYYFLRFPLDLELYRPELPGGIEYSFAVPLPVTHPETEDPILYAGRYDLNAMYNNTIPFIVDEKTTTQLGPLWRDQWQLDSQFLGYVWGKQQYGLRNHGVLIRGIAIRAAGYDAEEVIIYHSPEQIDNWFSQTCDLLEEMKYNWKRGVFRQALGFSCTRRGKCTFFDVCRDPKPEDNLYHNFIQQPYNPLGKMEDWE